MACYLSIPFPLNLWKFSGTSCHKITPLNDVSTIMLHVWGGIVTNTVLLSLFFQIYLFWLCPKSSIIFFVWPSKWILVIIWLFSKFLVNAKRALIYLLCSVLTFIVLPLFEILVASVNVLQIGGMRKFFHHYSILSEYTLRSILS